MINYKTVGIIGGMGAISTVDIFQKIVILTDAKNDQEHIPILIDNNTKIPDRTAFLLNKGISPRNYLINSANRLKLYGADILLLACNTAHYFLSDIKSVVNCPIINTIKETAIEAANKGIKRIGILGTEGFMRFVEFKSIYNNLNIDVFCPSPEEQKHINDLIYNGIKEQDFNIDLSSFLNVLKRMSSIGVESFALSCTELPIAFSHFNINYHFIDSNLIVAKKAITEAGGNLKTKLFIENF